MVEVLSSLTWFHFLNAHPIVVDLEEEGVSLFIVSETFNTLGFEIIAIFVYSLDYSVESYILLQKLSTNRFHSGTVKSRISRPQFRVFCPQSKAYALASDPQCQKLVSSEG